MTRYTFTLTGTIELADPTTATLAAGTTTMLATASSEPERIELDPVTALHVLLAVSVGKGMSEHALGEHEVHMSTVDVIELD